MRSSRYLSLGKCRLLLGIVALVPTLVSWAHRAPGSLTTIAWNATSGYTEIVHRLHSHDIERGLASILGIAEFSIMDVKARARAALYVEQHFQVEKDSRDLRPILVGAELVGQYLFVYQELQQRLQGEMRIRNDILRDLYPAQLNQVNIDDDGVVRTLFFSGNKGWLDVEFGH
ncbi:MAG: hypothetical protein HOC23_05750 [Halieaceae bacterium]|jgi:hypothetical protein|nr:hypothetical protein [Halieaceae bacterium]